MINERFENAGFKIANMQIVCADLILNKAGELSVLLDLRGDGKYNCFRSAAFGEIKDGKYHSYNISAGKYVAELLTVIGVPSLMEADGKLVRVFFRKEYPFEILGIGNIIQDKWIDKLFRVLSDEELEELKNPTPKEPEQQFEEEYDEEFYEEDEDEEDEEKWRIKVDES